MSLFRSLSLRSALIAALHASAVRAEALAAWRTKLGFILAVSLVFCSVPQAHADSELHYADQGVLWTKESRSEFYSRDQGSRLMPLAWIRALKHEDGAGFLDDALGRYGYLPNPDSDTPGLPVGFLSVSEPDGVKTLAMTCSACHTRQIEIDGAAWRIDGGPGIVDIGSFFADLDAAYAKVLSEEAAFTDFSNAVLGASASKDTRDKLNNEVKAWFRPFNMLMQNGLPKPPGFPWGPARLDAVGLMFYRIAGLDIGAPSDRIIAGNIGRADAGVRYPFIWNAFRQDLTQWPGFVPNGDDILALGRNVGEVLGVFGVFHPTKDPLIPGGVDFLKNSSLNFSGLLRLETLSKQIGPPKWPRPETIDQALVAEGKKIFDREPKDGGCGPSCHEEKQGQARRCNQNTLATPVQDVHTDAREYRIVNSDAETGVLVGQINPKPPLEPLQPRDKNGDILTVSAVNSIIQAPLRVGLEPFEPLLDECLHNDEKNPLAKLEFLKDLLNQGLANLFHPPGESAPIAYELRVLHGIWAAAPYLHNGSVPTLAELLKPAAGRAASFKIGPAYDLNDVGLAKAQTKFGSYTYQTTADCDADRRDASGNSRCGHEFGTKLSPEEKKALLEYLKQL